MLVYSTNQRPQPVTTSALETDAARRDRVARRLASWLAAEPTPTDMLDTLRKVALRLDDSLPGGLALVTADVFLDIYCQCLLYCDLDDLLAVWPQLSPGRSPAAAHVAGRPGLCDNAAGPRSSVASAAGESLP
ncbi:MAG: hypothetical protein IT340_17380 [Chloroflexi bacterium]|nr:hypothetical protein [Chloroflexota bacterium]